MTAHFVLMELYGKMYTNNRNVIEPSVAIHSISTVESKLTISASVCRVYGLYTFVLTISLSYV